jgi:ABC-type uncharacterized transport system substrate-binding protein
MKTILVWMVFITSVFAHPHTFIEVFPTIKTDKNQITQIEYKWVFDDMTSSMLLMEYDTNGNGKIDENENDFIYKNYFLPLDEYGFYTTVTSKGKSYKLKNIKNFQTQIIDNKIVYKFTVDNNLHLQNTQIEFGDKDFFVAMVVKKEFVKSEVKYKVSDMDNDFYFGYKLEFN